MLNRRAPRAVYIDVMPTCTVMFTLATLLALFSPLPLAADPAADAYRHAHACLASNRYAEAAALFETATASTNASVAASAWIGRGEALYRERAWPAAADAYNGLLKRFPESPLAPQALCSRGHAEHRAGRLPEALTTFTTFTNRFPDHALAPACADAADTLSRTLAGEAKRRDTEAISRDLAAINALVRDGAFQQAADACERFLLVRPDTPKAPDLRYLLAFCALRAKDYARAADAYGDYLAKDPRHAQAARARVEWGDALRALSRYGEAADAYADAPGPEAPLLCADCLFKAGRYEEALARYEAITRAAPRSAAAARAALGLGDCAVALRRWEAAERAFLNVEVLQASDDLRPVALSRLADLYDHRGDTNRAVRTRADLRRRYPLFSGEAHDAAQAITLP